MPPPTLTIGSLSAFASGSPLERSFLSSSLRSSPSKQGKASPVRVPQKSFGRQPARVAAAPASPVAPAPASVVAQSDDDLSSLTLSLDDTEFVHGLHQEIARDWPMIENAVNHKRENTKLRAEIEVLRQELQELQDLRDSSTKNDDVWQRENARLKEQLTAANTREVTQQEQLRVHDERLALCRQELLELQEHQLKDEQEQTAPLHPPAEEVAISSGLGRERELLKLVVQLVGGANVRAVLHENPTASPAQLREAIVRLRCPQCRRLSPPSRTRILGSGHTESLHKMLFGTSSRSPSPTAIRFNSMGIDPHSSKQ